MVLPMFYGSVSQAVLGGGGTSTISSHPTLTTSLFSFYPLANDANDAHSTNNGTNNGATFTGTHADFDGVNDYISIPNPGYGDVSFSVNTVVTIDAVNADYDWVFSTYEGRAEYYSVRLRTSNHWYPASRDSTGVNIAGNSSTTFSTGTEYMVTMVRDTDNNTFKLYVDGVEVYSAADTRTGDFISTLGIFYIGTAGTTGGTGAEPDTGLMFDGKQRLFGVWSKALSTSEISDLYNGGSYLEYN